MDLLPKDVLRLILWKYVSPRDWISCLKAHSMFHVLNDYQKAFHYRRLGILAKYTTLCATIHAFDSNVSTGKWWSGSWKGNILVPYKKHARKCLCRLCGDMVRLSVLEDHQKHCDLKVRHCKNQGCDFSASGLNGPWQLMQHEWHCDRQLWMCVKCNESGIATHDRHRHLKFLCRGFKCYHCPFECRGLFRWKHHVLQCPVFLKANEWQVSGLGLAERYFQLQNKSRIQSFYKRRLQRYGENFIPYKNATCSDE